MVEAGDVSDCFVLRADSISRFYIHDSILLTAISLIYYLILHILQNPVSCGVDGLLGNVHDAADAAFFQAHLVEDEDEDETNVCRINVYSYYSKVVAKHKLWFVYTMIYPDDYKDVLSRLFEEINNWQVFDD